MQAHERLEMEMAIDELKKDMHLTIKQAEACSEVMHHYFIALQDKGFTRNEALKIVMAHGVNIGGK